MILRCSVELASDSQSVHRTRLILILASFVCFVYCSPRRQRRRRCLRRAGCRSLDLHEGGRGAEIFGVGFVGGFAALALRSIGINDLQTLKQQKRRKKEWLITAGGGSEAATSFDYYTMMLQFT